MSEESDKSAKNIFSNPEPPEPGAMTGPEGTKVPMPSVEVETGGVDPHDHSAEAAAVAGAEEKAGIAPPPAPSHVELPLSNAAMMPGATDPLLNEIEKRFRREDGELDVEATEQDRESFVRAALHDEELILEVPLEGVGATVSVAIPPDVFTTSAASAASKWGKDGFNDPTSEMQWLLAFQQMHVWFQVRAVNGEPTPWSDLFADGLPSVAQLREKLGDPDNFNDIFTISGVRWRMLLDATRIAEYKYKICLENWREKNFFTGADTD